MKKLLVILVSATIAFSSTIVSYAAEWKQDSNGWWYQNDDGGYPSATWQEINGKQYYFDANGYMLHDTTTPDGYKVGSDGAWIQENTAFSNLVYPVDIIGGGFGENSVGGISPSVAFRNNSGKDIKYITFEMTPYNTAKDPVNCSIRGYSTTTCRAIGPYAPDTGVGEGAYSITSGLILIYDNKTEHPYYYTSRTHEKVELDKSAYAKTFSSMPGWDSVWYNNSIFKIVITKAIVDYTDGTSDTISSLDVPMFHDKTFD